MTIFKEAGLPVKAGLGLAFLILIAGLLRGEGATSLVGVALSAAAALLPVSLPALGVLSLHLGKRRMLARNARARNLGVVDRLGKVSVICSDQTGTLTENRMTVAVLDMAGNTLDLSEKMDRTGSFFAVRGLSTPAQSALSLTAIGAALCNDAALMEIDEGQYHTVGDATDGALLTAAARLGYWKSSLDASFPRAAALPFDPERKRMTTVHDLFEYDQVILSGLQIGIRRYIAFTKGSVEGLLPLSTSVWLDGESHAMDAVLAGRIQATQARLMQQGMRVLGVAYRLLDELPVPLEEGLEQDLTILGLFGMVDPPRTDVMEALAGMKAAGLRTVMVTGDAPLGAVETARTLGILEPQPAASPTLRQVMTGVQLEKLSAEDLAQSVGELRVFARLDPAQKLKIVEALQAEGEVVALTGDGLSDAPALQRADVGAVMGLSGTPASKESAGLVLLDDSFAALAAGVEEGRHARNVLNRVIHFCTAGNLSRLLVVLIAPVLGIPPLPPLQLLWLSLVTDGLLGAGVSLEEHEKDPPRRPAFRERFKTPGVGLLTAAFALGLGAWSVFSRQAAWGSPMFAFLAFAQFAHVLAMRPRRIAPAALGLMEVAFALQMAALYLPTARGWLGLEPPGLFELPAAVIGAAVLFGVLEIGRRVLYKAG